VVQGEKMRKKSFIKTFNLKFWTSTSKRDYRCNYCKKLLQRKDMYFVFPAGSKYGENGYGYTYDRVCDGCVVIAIEDLKKLINNKEELYNTYIKKKVIEGLRK
jgi:hypothetical protein